LSLRQSQKLLSLQWPLPFQLGQRVVNTGACALNGEDRRICAGCPACIAHIWFDQKTASCLYYFSSLGCAAGRQSLLSWPKLRNRPPQVGDWIIDLSLKHG
jgi:hypothetical protein